MINFYCFLGDSAYNLSPWLIKVILYSPNMTNDEREFNRRVCSVRSIIERVIGLLKMRFRCLLGERQLRYNQTKVGRIIYSCATLHNFLISRRFDIMHGIDLDNFNEEFMDRDVPNVNNNANHQINGINRRNELIRHFRM